eukprot:TRINITY_DN61734_c0_g1_i1.p1 TRINITY_DN61734_c0_g1~~TRINITY_DN61734_c0_g1_i1.p1  ORF type:complete len:435 (-),score=62.78 TRINITY_DN61734_c0_g1_i1:415-1719(-)
MPSSVGGCGSANMADEMSESEVQCLVDRNINVANAEATIRIIKDVTLDRDQTEGAHNVIGGVDTATSAAPFVRNHWHGAAGVLALIFAVVVGIAFTFEVVFAREGLSTRNWSGLVSLTDVANVGFETTVDENNSTISGSAAEEVSNNSTNNTENMSIDGDDFGFPGMGNFDGDYMVHGFHDDSDVPSDYAIDHEPLYDPKAKPLACFPGEAVAEVRGRGSVPMDALRVGDDVLVYFRGHLVFEPVLSFLHALRCDGHASVCNYVAIQHLHGELRISDQHLVFSPRNSTTTAVAAAQLIPGDVVVCTLDGHSGVQSVVQTVERATTRRGMFAPLTASGTLIVDGVVASVYAGVVGMRPFTHAGAHAAFFFLRAYHAVMREDAAASDLTGIRARRRGAVNETGLHPFALFLLKGLGLDVAFAVASRRLSPLAQHCS